MRYILRSFWSIALRIEYLVVSIRLEPTIDGSFFLGLSDGDGDGDGDGELVTSFDTEAVSFLEFRGVQSDRFACARLISPIRPVFGAGG